MTRAGRTIRSPARAGGRGAPVVGVRISVAHRRGTGRDRARRGRRDRREPRRLAARARRAGRRGGGVARRARVAVAVDAARRRGAARDRRARRVASRVVRRIGYESAARLLGGRHARRAAPRRPRRCRAGPAVTAGRAAGGARAPRSRVAVGIAVMVAVAVVALGPSITDHLGRHVWPGLDPSVGDLLGAPSSLRATPKLDMTARPRLSDRVVFTVNAPRGEFWRGQTFDSWNGTRGRSPTRSRRCSTAAVPSVAVPRDETDAGAFSGQAMRQTFRVETGYSNVVFAAPSPVSVETDRMLQGHPDGTVTVDGGFGRGSTYTVTSRRVLATAALLRAADSIAEPRCSQPVRAGSGHDQSRAGAGAPDHRVGAHHLRQDPRDRGVARRARALLDPCAARAARVSTSSTTSCSARASVGASRSRAVSS